MREKEKEIPLLTNFHIIKKGNYEKKTDERQRRTIIATSIFTFLLFVSVRDVI